MSGSEGRGEEAAARELGGVEAEQLPPRLVRESLRDESRVGLYEYGEWQERFPGLACGVTAAGPGADFGVGTASPTAWFLEAHARLAAQLGFRREAIVRQVHGDRVVRVGGPRGWGGEVEVAEASEAVGGGAHLHVAGVADGLVTRASGVLLTITAADCVPVYLVDPISRVLGLFHAGWRGTAAGVLERGAKRALDAGARPERLHLHLGPAICGGCYEVGPEVAAALGLPASGSVTVDLRAVLADRAHRLGVAASRISRSVWCTCCGGERFHSHRGMGERAGRMAAFLGWNEASHPGDDVT